MDPVPDCRDGLDVTQRRVLHTLDGEYRVCADLAMDPAGYDALVALAQPFRRRHPLVDGRGNFGSVDDDPPADPEYTQARLAPIADDRLRFPNVLVNGSRTIPPHSLRETVAAALALLGDPDTDLGELMAHIPGPDFPTGGVIVGRAGLRALYETGTGTIVVRARSHIEGDAIVVTELPFTVAKGGDNGVIRRIADYHARGPHPVLRNLEDHSDRDGVRVIITLRHGADTEAVLDALHAHTSLEVALHAELLALIGGEPRRLTLRELLLEWIGDRDPVTVRRELENVARRYGDERRTSITPR